MTAHVPTVAELYARGREYAYPVRWVKGKRKGDPPVPSVWHVTPLGHQVLGEAMRANALEAVAAGAGEWSQPPSRQIAGMPTGATPSDQPDLPPPATEQELPGV